LSVSFNGLETVLAFSLLLSPETNDNLSIFVRLAPQLAEAPQWAVAPIVAHHWMTASPAQNWCWTVFSRALTVLPRALTVLNQCGLLKQCGLLNQCGLLIQGGLNSKGQFKMVHLSWWCQTVRLFHV
jgi:hypothetical protein